MLCWPNLHLKVTLHAQQAGVKEKRQQRRVANHGLRMWKVAAEVDLAFFNQVQTARNCHMWHQGIAE